MAASSIFGDSLLFDEFERDPEPSDKILRQKLLTDERVKRVKTIDDGSDSAFSAECHAESCESDGVITEDSSDDNDAVNEVAHPPKYHNVRKNEEDKSLHLNIQLKELTKENERLKKQMNLISCDVKKDSCQESPAVQVLFMNHQVSRKYKTEIEDFIHHLIQNDNKNETLKEINLRPNSVYLSEHVGSSVTSSKKIQKIRDAVAIGCEKFYTEFIIDSMGWPLVDYNPIATDGWQTPLYEQFYYQSLPIDEDDDETDRPVKPQRAKATCFNCGGDHSLKDCLEKKDFRKINKARKEFMDNNSQMNTGLKKQRYIIEECSSNDERFKPGEISTNLRDALGINTHQLPPYIYQMRSLGYPPGWLLDAEIMHSGVAIFDKFGKEVSEDGASTEDGEVDVNEQQKKKYNSSKVVSYPGFNIDPPEGTVDEYKKLNMLPMQPCHQKEALELFMKPLQLKDTNSKKRSSNTTYPGKEKKPRTDEMELVPSDNDDKLPSENECNSPIVTALRKKGSEKEIIDITQEDGEIVEEEFIPPVPPTPERPPLPIGTPPVTPQSESKFKTPLPTKTPEMCKVNSKTKDTSSTGQTCDLINGHLMQSPNSSSGSLSSAFGTPVLDHGSPHASNNSKGLPQASKFAAGITEHIPFENLPQATGKYSQMKKVLDWVRSKSDK